MSDTPKTEPGDGHAAAEHVRRLRPARSTTFPTPAPRGEAPWGNERDTHARRTSAEILASILAMDDWQEIMRPWLDELQQRRSLQRGRGPAALYTPHHLEGVVLFGALNGCWDRQSTIRLVGQPEQRAARSVLSLPFDAAPSPTRLHDYEQAVSFDERRAVWAELLSVFTRRYIDLGDPCLCVRLVDGTDIEVTGQCPKRRRVDDGTIIILNEDKNITCWDGGYRKPAGIDGTRKGGHGFTLVILLSAEEVPIAYRLIPMDAQEAPAVAECIGQVAPALLRAVGTDQIVMVGDTHTVTMETRPRIHQAGIIPCVHDASHSPKDESRAHVATRDGRRFTFVGHEHFMASELWEVFCACGQPAGRGPRARRGPRGAHVWTEYYCANDPGEAFTLIAGQWVLDSDRGVFRRPRNEEAGDYRVGNPLTFHSPEAAAYIKVRRSRGEGWNGTLKRIHSLRTHTRRWRTRAQAELEINMMLCIQLAKTLQHKTT